MRRYYFLAASLPPLKLEEMPELGFDELILRFKVNLSQKHYALTRVIRRLIDVENIRRLLLSEPLDIRGNLNEKELDEALLNREDLAEYIYDFFHKYETKEEKLNHFSEVIAAFFLYESTRNRGFISEYLSFERKLRLVLTALRAKLLGRDLLKELQFEEIHEPFVMQILAQKDTPDYLPPPEFQEVKEIMQSYHDAPLDLHRKIEEFRYKRVEEMGENKLFGVDSILSYMVRLMIVENWMALNEAKGASKLSGLVVQELKK